MGAKPILLSSGRVDGNIRNLGYCTMSTLLRPLSTSELLDRAFFLYRNNFVVFAGIAAIAELPVLALRLGNSALILARHSVSRPVAILIILVANFVAVGVSHAGTVIAVSDVHLDRRASIRSAYATASRSLLRVVWLSFVVTLLIPLCIGVLAASVVGWILVPMSLGRVGALPVASGMVILAGVAPACYWWVARALVVPVTMLEGTGLIDSMARSRVLTEGRRGQIFVICLLVVALTWAVTWLFQSPAYAIGGLHLVGGRLIASHWAAAILAAGAFVGASLAGPLLTIALTLVYYDGRVRKEAFDLELMLANLSSVPGTVVPDPAGRRPTFRRCRENTCQNA